MEVSKTVCGLTRICTSPNAVPALESEQRRYITRWGEVKVSGGEPQLKGPILALQPSIRVAINPGA